ncbi:MAG TPA: type II CAAX endopeptidase family protein [Mucilaginibacter sp.]|nr:type II CAAX endopeptidase family protein [Mucilaginibacter sp.]
MTETEPGSILMDGPGDVIPRPAFTYPDLKALVKIFFALLFSTVVFGIFARAFLAFLNDENIKSPLIRSFLNLVTYLAVLLLTIRYAVKKRQKQTRAFFAITWGKIQRRMIPVFIISALALIVGLEWLSTLMPMPQSIQKLFENAFRKDIFSIVTMVVAAPILEEVLCRGIILHGLLKRYSVANAILISAIFFALIHMNPWQALPAFAGGIFIGWVYYKTQSIVPGIIIHATINATASAFLFLPRRQQGFRSLLGPSHYLILCVIAIVIYTIGCIVIYKRGSIMHESNERVK